MMSDDNDDPIDDQNLADEWAAALEGQAEGEAAAAENVDDLLNDVASSELEDFGSNENQESSYQAAPGSPNLDVVLDIPVTLSMEVGSTSITIRNLLQLNQGSVIELDRLAGEPLDVLVNGTLVAHGEVVVVNEKFGIRLTDVISPQERIKKLA